LSGESEKCETVCAATRSCVKRIRIARGMKPAERLRGRVLDLLGGGRVGPGFALSRLISLLVFALRGEERRPEATARLAPRNCMLSTLRLVGANPGWGGCAARSRTLRATVAGGSAAASVAADRHGETARIVSPADDEPSRGGRAPQAINAVRRRLRGRHPVAPLSAFATAGSRPTR